MEGSQDTLKPKRLTPAVISPNCEYFKLIIDKQTMINTFDALILVCLLFFSKFKYLGLGDKFKRFEN
jgi:hypothetical protein